MAKVINEKNHLRDKYNKRLGIFSIELIVWLIFLGALSEYWIFIFIIGSIVINFSYSELRKLGSGLRGELKAKRIYSKLPDNYYVLSDLEVEINGGKSQVDNIIVGNNGIFVIEAKNLNGKITGNENDKEVIQHKIGRKGGIYSNRVYNPIKQVATHVYRVSKVLNENNIRFWVEGMVYFTNISCNVKLSSNKTPIFSSRDNGDRKIIDYILTYDRSIEINEDQKEKIVTILSRYCIEG